MKRLLLVLALLLMLASPVMAATSFKDTFDDEYVLYDYRTTPAGYYGDWYAGNGMIISNGSSTTGRVYVGGNIKTIDPSLYTYAAYTFVSMSPNQGNIMHLQKSDGSTLASYMFDGTVYNRYEAKVNSTHVNWYKNGVWLAAQAVSTNPTYFNSFGNGGVSVFIDDVVVGYEEDSTIIGTIPPTWFIKFDAASPASTGLYKINTSDVSMPILQNSNYYSVTYGRSTSTSTTLNIIDPAGNVVDSYPIANMSCAFNLPIENLKSDGAIRNGLWRVSLADSATSGYLWVMGSGASGEWSQESYTQGDTATFRYTILDSSWNTGTSTYRFDVLDVYGNVVDTQSITTQTGAKTVSLDSTDYPSGVYYGAVIQTTSGEDTWLAADAMEVSAYIKYMGGIYDAESEAQITSNVAVNITQGSITDTIYTETGVYNSTDGLAFGTGALTTFTVSASGYQTSVTSFTPMIAKTIVKNITLIRSSPTCPVGICLGGLANETIYSRPVANVTIAVTNTTYGESYTTSTNSVGWYNLGESDGVFLTNGRCYSVTASKTGYTGSTYLKCVVGT